ncbi:hypothetical protein [Nonlabens sp.]|uniref:hypothetical protein n=1 Tax=Nonlabens sp. TaxID=1888209 RepID=UPI001BCD8AC3|nr:hypothetical protein [Nonlabens sp.]
MESYLKVGGDVDHLQRMGTPEEKTLENQKIMGVMDELIYELKLLKGKLASTEYVKEIEFKLKNLCTDEAVITKIKNSKPFR